MTKKNFFIFVLLFLFASNSYAWVCGVQQLDVITGNSDLDVAMVEKIYHGSKVTVSASINFYIEEASRKYNPEIYLKNSKGEIRKFAGRWEGRNDLYLSTVDVGPSNDKPFKSRFVIKFKNGKVAYDTGWLQCE